MQTTTTQVNSTTSNEYHLINFKIVDKTLKPKKKNNEIYNTCIIQYLPVAQDIMNNVAKIYLYQVQQNKNVIDECFEKYENSTILKMTKNVKDLKINSFENYEYLKSFKLYPDIGYSLFYTKKDNSKIALIKNFKTFFGYSTYSIVVKWNITKIKFYNNIVLNTSNIIKSVADSIFQYSRGINDKDLENSKNQQETHESEKLIVLDILPLTINSAAETTDIDSKTLPTQLLVEHGDNNEKEEEESKKTVGFLEKIRNFLAATIGKTLVINENKQQQALQTEEIFIGPLLDNQKQEEKDNDDEKNVSTSSTTINTEQQQIETKLLAIASNNNEIELVKSLIQSVNEQLSLQESLSVIPINSNQCDDNNDDNINDDYKQQEYIKEYNVIETSSILNKSYNLQNIIPYRYASNNETSNSDMRIFAYQSVVNELYDKFDQNDTTSSLIKKCQTIFKENYNIVNNY